MENLTLGDLDVILTSLEYSRHYIENYQYPSMDKPEDAYRIKLDRLKGINNAMAKVRDLKKQLSGD